MLDKLDSAVTALVLVDLQQGVVRLPVEPLSGVQVVARACAFATTLRERKVQVILIRSGMSPDHADLLSSATDSKFQVERKEDWAQIMPELGPRANDLVITKRQWGGFYGTDLDLQLRRRHIDTILIGGIATNYGVEATARSAAERGYKLIFVSDVMSSFTSAGHEFAIKQIFPYLGRVRDSAEVIRALE